MIIKVYWLLHPISGVKLFVNLRNLLFDLLCRFGYLHFLDDLLYFLDIEHLSSVGISLQEEHHGLGLKGIGFVNLIVEHDALDDEVLEPLPNEHLLLYGVHSNDVAVQPRRLQNQEMFFISNRITDVEFGEASRQGDIGVCDVLDFVQADQLGQVLVEDHLQDVYEFVVDVQDALAQHALRLVVVQALYSVGQAVQGFVQLRVFEASYFIRVHYNYKTEGNKPTLTK